jgi:hypothetical protein
MAHAFAPIPAKPAFGTLKENLYQSDYINRKKAKLAYCKTPSSYYNKNLGRYLRNLEICKIISINKSNLIIGQYTKLNLTGVCTVSTGTPPTQPCGNETDELPCNPCQTSTDVIIDPDGSSSIDVSEIPFYWYATIDPLGELFGSSKCGELNYTHHMVFYPPTTLLTLGSS